MLNILRDGNSTRFLGSSLLFPLIWCMDLCVWATLFCSPFLKTRPAEAHHFPVWLDLTMSSQRAAALWEGRLHPLQKKNQSGMVGVGSRTCVPVWRACWMSWRAQCQVRCKWCFGGCWLPWGWRGSCGSSEVGEGQMLRGSDGQKMGFVWRVGNSTGTWGRWCSSIYCISSWMEKITRYVTSSMLNLGL